LAKQVVEALVDGGKATAAPPLGPALGPLGVNIGQIVADINKKTASFKGMQVPVKISVDPATKNFEISIGTPPTSQLVIKEAKIQKGSGNPKQEKLADLKIEQVIKIAKMKEDALLGKTTSERVKEVIGTCNSMGILIEGKPAVEAIRDIEQGAFAGEIAAEKTELTAEELKQLEEEKKHLAEEIAKRREEFVATAKQIISSMQGKEKGIIKGKLKEAGIPLEIIDELLPAEEAGKKGAGAEKGAAAPKEEAKEAKQAKPAEKKEGKK